jgi:WD40 repeat protein
MKEWTRSPAPVSRSAAVGTIPKDDALRRLTGHHGSVLALCFWSSSGKGNILVSGGMDATVKTWSLDKDITFHILKGHTAAVRCLTVSRNEHPNPMVVSGGDDGKINMWSLLSGRLLHTLKGHHAGVLTLAMCTDDRYPIVVSGGQDKAIRLWNTNSGEFMFMLQGHDRAVTGLVISATCTAPPLLVSSSMDKGMRVWELSTGRQVRKLEGHMGRITCVAVSKDVEASPIVVSGDSTGAVIVWDLRKFKRLFNLIEATAAVIAAATELNASGTEEYFDGTHSGTHGEIAAVAISSYCENMVIITSTWGANVKFYDAKSGGLLRVLDGAIFGGINRVCICCDAVGPLLAMASVEGPVFLLSPEDDYLEACRSITSLREMSIEASLSLVGKYITYARLLDDTAGYNADSTMGKRTNADTVMLTIVFYCMIRFAMVNTSFFLANVDITADILGRTVDLVDLLFVDNFVGMTAMQFLLERRVCISLAQEWIRIEKNQVRVMTFLGDDMQSNDTLDCVLSALVTDNLEGWDMLVSHADFSAIFENLALHSPRSHSKLAYLISKYGLYAEPEPFHIPLDVSEDRDFTVTRLGRVNYDSKGVHCYRVTIQDRLPAEFFMTHKFLDALVSSDHVEELVATPLIKYVLQYRWDTWGYNATLGLGMVHILYCLSAMSAVFCICSEEYDECRVQPIHAISVTVVIFINTLYMGLSAIQYINATDFWSFITSSWQMAEVVMISLCHICILLGTALGPSFAIRQVSAVFSLLLWAWLPYYGRGSFGLAGLLHQMRIIIYEVRYFVGILALINGAFAVAFRILDIYESVWYASIRCFNMMLGDVHFDLVSGHTFGEILYLIFLISVCIILLNSLIAFMEGSLGSAREKESVMSLISRAQFLSELEVKLQPFNRLAACFSSSTGRSKQDFLSPSAIFVKDGSSGPKMGRKGVRTGDPNELVILFPESLGLPVLTSEDAKARDVGFKRQSNRPKGDNLHNSGFDHSQSHDNKTSRGDSETRPDEFGDRYHDRLEHVELQVSTLDKKMDMMLNLLNTIHGNSSTAHSPSSAARGGAGVGAGAVSLDPVVPFSYHSTPADTQHSGTGGQGYNALNSSTGGSGGAPSSVGDNNNSMNPTPGSENSADGLMSYSYFGSADRDEDDNDTEEA